MKKKIKRKINNQSGAAMLIVVVFFLFISLAIISGLVGPTVREFRNASVNLNSKQSYFLAESGSEDVFYRVRNGITVGNSEVINLGSNSATTEVNTLGGNSKEIISLGDVSNLKRKTKILLSSGAGVGFNYGIQSGNGGMTLDSTTIYGNVYANGNISAKDVTISGTAVAAGSGITIGRTGLTYYALKVGQNGIGDVWASNVVSTSAAGYMYCQTKGSWVNKICDTSKGIPPVQPMPFTQENIDTWKAEGTAGGIITGSTKCPGGSSGGNCTVNYAGATFGPGKITGNLIVNGGGTLTLTGTVYVVGTVTVSNGAHVVLPTNFSQYSATIISDGVVLLNGGSYTGSGTLGSYLFVVTTNTGNPALTVSNGSGAIAVCAQDGTIALIGGISINAAVGKKITAAGGTTITYQQGLASPSFQSGPSGSWVLQSWEETQ